MYIFNRNAMLNLLKYDLHTLNSWGESIYTASAHATNLCNEFENYIFNYSPWRVHASRTEIKHNI